MANESGDYDQELEDRIIKIVKKTREKRCRPCFQSIHTKLNQGGKEINMDDLKVFIEDLVKTGLLINKGIIGKESYYLANVEQSEIENGDLYHDNNISSVEKFVINETFYQTLIARINNEVKTTIKIELECYSKVNKLKSVNDREEFPNEQTDYRKLHETIKSLRAELKSKEEIIKKLRNVNNGNKSSKKLSNASRINSDNKNNFDKNMNSDISKQNTIEDDVFTKVSNELNNNKRSVTILGDSIVKDIKPFKMKRMLGKNEKLYVKSFPGATTNDMFDYCKPTIRRNPNMVIYHAGTNNLCTGDEPNTIASDIIKLALDMKNDSNEVSISSLIVRNDKLNEKALKVNDCLKVKCSQYALGFIDNSNVTKVHLNNSGLHLNFKGTIVLAKNFMAHIQT